jgi:hypothetical protein
MSRNSYRATDDKSNVFVKQYEQKANKFALCRCEKMTKFIERFR